MQLLYAEDRGKVNAVLRGGRVNMNRWFEDTVQPVAK